MDRRSEVRVQKNLLVSISKKGFEGMGLTADISRGGIMLATTEILPDKSQVVLVVGIQNNTFTLQGRVIWSKNPFNELGADISCGSGISLDDPPLEYLDYVEQLLSELL